MRPSAIPARSNWAGNYTYRAASVVEPASVQELCELVRTLPRSKALGARHSFNHIADTAGTQISLANFKARQLDPESRTLTVGAGVAYGEIAPWLYEQGFALRNLASLPHISIVGACATGTHGSGLRNQCLSASVSGLEMVTATGELLRLSRETHPEMFAGAVVALGALGIVTAVTLDLVPAFEVAQTVYENLAFDQLEDHVQEIFGAAYSVSLFTDWQHGRAAQLWLKQTLDGNMQASDVEQFFGATRQMQKLHPLAGMSPENCTEQLGHAGPWYDRLPHFRHDYVPSAGAELQSEYFVPLTHAVPAIRAVEALRERITPHLFISELRTVAADDLWLSPAYGRGSLAIHFTWKPESEAVLSLLPVIEQALEPFGARPHWAKLFTTPAERIAALYPKFDEFKTLMRKFDPDRRFRNEYLNAIF